MSGVQTLSELKALLAERGMAPRKALGQNFLIDHNLLTRLIECSGVGEGDVVLEVGPGAGALTEPLLERGCVVVAVELDRGLADLIDERLARRFPGALTLVRGDCLAGKREINPEVVGALRERCAGKPFSLVANLPYQAGTAVMMVLLESHMGVGASPRCRGMWVTIQKEVADRLAARPGTDDFGGLSVMAQALAQVRRIAVLPPECFWPRPAVTSAMVEVTALARPLTTDPSALGALTQRLFGQRRKKIGTVLGREGPSGPGGWPEGISPDQRAETLTLAQWCGLSEQMAKKSLGRAEGIK